jgi:hypothetical protein
LGNHLFAADTAILPVPFFDLAKRKSARHRGLVPRLDTAHAATIPGFAIPCLPFDKNV